MAIGLRLIADCKMYGLLEGGPEVDVARCDEFIKEGEARGLKPSQEPSDLAMEIIAMSRPPNGVTG